MTIALMFESFIILPKIISYIVLIGLVVAGIAEFRSSHIGRIGIFLNSLMLWQIFYSTFNGLPVWFQWYLNIGTIVGIVALVSYIIKKSLPTKFYQGCFILYGSFSILFAISIGLFVVPSIPHQVLTSNVTG